MIVESFLIKHVARSRHQAVSAKKPLGHDPFHLGLHTAGKNGDAFVASQETGLDDHICVCHLQLLCKQAIVQAIVVQAIRSLHENNPELAA